MHLNLASKMFAVFIAIALFGVLAMLLIYRALNEVLHEVEQLAEVEEPLILSGYEMEINMNGIGLAVQMYLSTRSTRYRDWANKDMADFDHFRSIYRKLIHTKEEHRLEQELSEQYSTFRELGQALMQHADERRALFETAANNLEHIDRQIEQDLRPAIDHGSTWVELALRKAAASAQIEAETAELGFWTSNYRHRQKPEYKAMINDKIGELNAALALFNGLDLTNEGT